MQPPNGPEIGGATYGTGLLIGSSIGQHQVVAANGSQMLQVTPGEASDGTLIECNPPPGSGPRIGVHDQFQVQPRGVQPGLNAWIQQIILEPLGTNLQLMWPADGLNVFLNQTTPNGTPVLTDLGLAYSAGTLHTVDWLIDLDADVFSLLIDGNTQVSNLAIGADAQSLRQLAFSSNFLTQGGALVDNVRIDVAVVPEPGSALLVLAALAALLLWGRHAPAPHHLPTPQVA